MRQQMEKVSQFIYCCMLVWQKIIEKGEEVGPEVKGEAGKGVGGVMSILGGRRRRRVDEREGHGSKDEGYPV